MKKTVLLFGSNGFLGNKIYKTLFDKYNIIRLSHSLKTNDKDIFNVNKDYSNLDIILRNINFDYIIYNTWSGGVTKKHFYLDKKTQNKNIELFEKFCQLLKDKKYKNLLFVSSCQVYAENKNNYGLSKFYCEEVMIKNNIKHTVLYFSSIFGENDFSQRSTNIILDKLVKNEEVEVVNKEFLYDWIHIDNIVNAIDFILQNDLNNNKYYIGNRDIKTLYKIIKNCKYLLNSKSVITSKNIKANNIDYKELTKFSIFKENDYNNIIKFEKSILNTVEWRKNNGK